MQFHGQAFLQALERVHQDMRSLHRIPTSDKSKTERIRGLVDLARFSKLALSSTPWRFSTILWAISKGIVMLNLQRLSETAPPPADIGLHAAVLWAAQNRASRAA